MKTPALLLSLLLSLLALALLPQSPPARARSKSSAPAWCISACKDALKICKKTCDRPDVPVNPRKCKEKACPAVYNACMKECAKEKGDDGDEEEQEDAE